MGEVIAVLSGKGGTGKTSLCAAIAAALTEADKKVLCIDCDVGLGDLDIFLAMRDSDILSFEEVYKGNYTLSQAARYSAFPKLSFLAAPIHMAPEAVDGAAFAAMLSRAKQKFDYILLDAPTGMGTALTLCAANAHRVLLVTTQEPAAVRDASRMGQALELMGKTNVRLIVNRVREKLLEETKRTIDDVMDEAGLPLLGLVPEDENVTLAAALEKPLLRHTQKGAAAACRRIAKRIQGLPEPVDLRKI